MYRIEHEKQSIYKSEEDRKRDELTKLREQLDREMDQAIEREKQQVINRNNTLRDLRF